MSVCKKNYKDQASYAYVVCTTRSDADVFSTGAAYMFDTDLASVVYSSDISSDITWDEDGGTFTFANAGVYHVIVTAITSADTNQTQTVQINQYTGGVGTTRLEGVGYFNTGYEPKEHTWQRIISAAAGDIIDVKVTTNTGGGGIEKGSSIIIKEITSGDYASQTVSTGATYTSAAEINPFDTSVSSGAAIVSAFKVSSGIAISTNSDKLTVPRDGRYFIMVTNNLKAKSAAAALVTIYLNKNSASSSGELQQKKPLMRSNDDPSETTLCTVYELEASDYLTVTWDPAGGVASNAEKGATFTAYRLSDGEFSSATDMTGWYGDQIISVQQTAQDSDAAAADINPFSDADFSSNATYVTSFSDGGITHNSSNGKFTVSEPGLYAIFFTPLLSVSAGLLVTSKILVGSKVVATNDTQKVSADPDPLDRSLSALVELEKNDEITVTVDGDHVSNTLTAKIGTQLTIFRYFNHFKKGDHPSAGDILTDDNIINTYSDELSEQFSRNVDQVPFILGHRCAGTLRGRCGLDNGSVVHLGDKKN